MIPIKTTNTESLYRENSTKARMEKNDCVVRAIASSFEVDYESAHKFVKELFQRRDRDGTNNYIMVMKMKDLRIRFGKSVEQLGIIIEGSYAKQMLRPIKYSKPTKYRQYTLQRFIADYPKGNYFVLVRGHALSIKDGVIFGNRDDGDSPKTRVLEAFKIG